MGTKTNAGPSNLFIAGFALLLFSSILMGVGIHHVIKTGSCSSTGYNSYGPVQTCPPGTGWWVAFIMFGTFAGMAGGFMASSAGLSGIFFGIFGGIGVGALSLLFDSSASSGTQVFAAIFGGAFGLVGGICGLILAAKALTALRSAAGGGPARGRPSPPARSSEAAHAQHGSAQHGSAAHGAGPHRSHAQRADGQPAVDFATNAFRGPSPETPATGAAADPLDQIARLAELHRSGALTDEEFAQEKARILKET